MAIPKWQQNVPSNRVIFPMRYSVLRRAGAVIFVVACILGNSVNISGVVASGIQPEPITQHASRNACGQVSSNRARCLSTISTERVADPITASPNTSGFYGPTEFHTAYQLPCTPGGVVQAVCATPSTYGPETIAIVDAGGYASTSGTLEADLQTYTTHYGLPACTAANGCLTIVNQTGAPSPLPANVSSGWSNEIALDVQVAHTICQTCKIVLVEANDDTLTNLVAAEDTAATFAPVAISNSWGATTDVSAYDSHFTRTGVAVVAATGDNGTNSNGQSWPADIPAVVAVSGSTLRLNTNNTWASETLWSGSGGGCSTSYTAPAWQTSRSDWVTNGCSNGGRAFGDVAADGDPNTGAAVYVDSGWYMVGGTSLASPLIAAMYALQGAMPAGTSAVKTLYQNSSQTAFHDITSGSDCVTSGQLDCTASAGFDVPTGLGAPTGLSAFVADPTPPYNLMASHINQTQLNISWATASALNGISNYQIYRDGSLTSTSTANGFSDTGLTPNSYYTYYLKTVDNKGGVSSPSETLAADTFLLPDINRDGHINLLDFSLLASKYGQTGGSLGRSDINGDGVVNLLDFSLLASKYGTE